MRGRLNKDPALFDPRWVYNVLVLKTSSDLFIWFKFPAHLHVLIKNDGHFF